MTAELTLVQPNEQQDLTAIERVIVVGDLSKLSPAERWDYYKGVCQSVSLNPFTRPFDYVMLSGKLTLYANKGAAEQLRGKHHISIGKPDLDLTDGLCIVTVTATDRTGRTDSDLGIVPIENLRGDAKANAILKAITKAKRRVTLSMCGLGMLDETEVETIPGARIEDADLLHGGNPALPAPPIKTTDEVEKSAILTGAPTATPKCNKKGFLIAWHMAVKGTRFDEDEARHKFIAYHTTGAYSSLAEFLDDATHEQGDGLIRAITARIKHEAKSRPGPEPAGARPLADVPEDELPY